MKRILITGGPTNEYIDEVMKITNMSSGKVAIELANYFGNSKDNVTLMLTKNIKNSILDDLVKKDNFKLIRFETTDELLKAIMKESKVQQYDLIIHSAAVADYKPEFSFRMEDMAKEISKFVIDNATDIYEYYGIDEVYEEIIKILTHPNCKVNNNTKISSVEPNLTVKLGLTPKIIANLREFFPDAFICGFKLLENVPEEELIEAAMQQIQKCNTDVVFANDLAELRKGDDSRLVITPDGYDNKKVYGALGIYMYLQYLFLQA